MPLSQIAKQKSFDGVTTGGRASTRLPTNGTHYGLYLIPRQTTGAITSIANVCACIGQVQIFVNGDLKVQATAAEILLMEYHKTGHFPGCEPGALFATQFSQLRGIIPWRWVNEMADTFEQRTVFGLGCADVNSYEVQLEILNPTGATAIKSVDVFTDYNPMLNLPLGTHRTLLAYPRSFATTGLREEKDIPFGDKSAGILAGYWIQKTTGTPGTLLTLRQKVNNVLVTDDVPPELLGVEDDGRRMVFPATYITDTAMTAGLHKLHGVLHNDLGGSAASMLDLGQVNDLRYTEDWSVTPGGAFDIVIEQIKGLVRK